MNIDDKELVMQFADDVEFTNWALKPVYEVVENEFGHKCYDVLFTDEYINALDHDYHFDILDPNSRVKIRQAVCRGFITKPVSNVIYWK